jgi:uncharacterized protein
LTVELKRPLRVAAIGDLHVTETAVRPYRELFAEIADKADVLALAGDLTNVGNAKEAEILAEDLRACTVPIVGVLGNHDHECGRADAVKETLAEAGVHFLEGHVYEIHGVGFAGAKGFCGGFGNRMLSGFGEDGIKKFVAEGVDEAMKLENALRFMPPTDRKVVVLHYAPIAATVEGEPPEIYPFLGSSRLAEVIDRFRVTAVFHGHAHRGAHRGETAKGIPVYNVAQMIPKESGRPYALIEV